MKKPALQQIRKAVERLLNEPDYKDAAVKGAAFDMGLQSADTVLEIHAGDTKQLAP